MMNPQTECPLMSVAGRPRAKLIFKPEAFAKMQLLIMKCSGEVGWHGLVERNENTFTVTDILVYPQQVTGFTITTDQPEYEKWNMEIPLEQFSKMRFHGHSHVNMETTPSGVDVKSKETVLSCIREGQFYIFMIWNKSLDYSVEIYDATGDYLVYEKCDVDIEIEGIGDMKKYLDDSIAKIKRIYPTYPTYTPKPASSYNYEYKPAQTTKPKQTTYYGGYWDDYEDDYSYYSGYYKSHLHSGT
ncbi:MAG: hypothetical protein ACI4J4_10240 [Ruminiclostridium sp.]